MWVDYDLNSSRATTGMEAGWQNTPRVYADLDHDGVRDPGEPQDDGETDGTFTLPVDTRDLGGQDRVDIRFSLVGVDQDPNWDFAFKCLPPAQGCVRNVEVNAGETTSGVGFPIVGPGQINGMIWDDKDDDGHREEGEDGVERLGVFIDDDRDGERDPGEPASHTTNVTGKYILPVPTRYIVAGGDLPPVVLERKAGVDCSAPAECAVTGLKARPSHVTTVEHGVARPVVIFLHGYGGSRIACGNKPLWFSVLSGNLGLVGPDLWDMRLGRDGRGLSRAAGGSECSEHAGVTGLLRDVAGGDIYGGASDHFKDIAWPGRAYDYVWDWRKSPEDAVAGLDALVEKARCGGEPPCDAKQVRRVSLVGHSMGGLVIRHYIEDDARADKVQRIVTVGTPYWGSPKTIFPVAAGVEVPMFSEMDALLDNGGLKAASRSFPGHFALMPAFGYGPWLSVAGMNGGRPLDVDGVEEYLRRIGADPMLYTRGASEHGRVLDHYRDHDIDYQVIVGGGLPSIGERLPQERHPGRGDDPLGHGRRDRARVLGRARHAARPPALRLRDLARAADHRPADDAADGRLRHPRRADARRAGRVPVPGARADDLRAGPLRAGRRVGGPEAAAGPRRREDLLARRGRAREARAGRDATAARRRSWRWPAPTCGSSCPPARRPRSATSPRRARASRAATARSRAAAARSRSAAPAR